MNRSRAQSQQNVRKPGSRIARHKSLEVSNVTSAKSYHEPKDLKGQLSKRKDPVDRTEKQPPPRNRDSTATLDWSFHSFESGSSRESNEIPEKSEIPPASKESNCFSDETRRMGEIITQTSATDVQSSGGEKSRSAVSVSMDKDELVPMRRLVYRQNTRNQACPVDKEMYKNVSAMDKESKLRKIIPDDSSNTTSNENFYFSSESEGQPERMLEFQSFAGETRVIRGIVPQSCSTSATEILSDEDKSIIAMPVELSRSSDPYIIKSLVYGEKKTPNPFLVDKNVEEQATGRKTDGGSGLRKMIPDGSYIISKENYIISNQPRLPPEILIRQRQPQQDTLSSGIPTGSVSEVVDNTKFNVTAACILTFLLVLTCLVWYFIFFRSPMSGPPPKNTSLLRYLLEHAYDALLQIYE